MKPTQYVTFMKECLINNPKQPIFLHGSMGIGKSEITKQISDDLNFDEFIDIRLSLLDAVDLRGLPTYDAKTNQTRWSQPCFLPPMGTKKNILLFFDEFSNASPSIQNACLQLMLDRKIGEYELSDSVRIVCAGNTLKDGAYVFKMSAPLNNRFIHINLDVDFEDFKKWAYNHNINPMVMGFLNFRRDLLFNYKEDIENNAFPTPRTWFFIHRLMELKLENGTLLEAVKGTIGEGAGIEFYSFMKIYRDLPNPEDILYKNKDIVPKEASQRYAIVSAILSIVAKDDKVLNRAIEYSMKLPKEFSVLFMQDLLKFQHLRTKITMNNKAFDKWIKENKEFIID